MSHSGPVDLAVWSPCSRFIAVACSNPGTVEVLDAVTHERLNTLNPLEKVQLPGFPSETTLWLSFSPDSRSLSQFSYGNRGLTTWDLQTGGLISTIPSTLHVSGCFSSTYSMDGKIVAVAHGDFFNTITSISTYNLLSGTHIYSHNISEGRIMASIWTHGERLRFVTVKSGSITIWEVGFTSMHTLTEVESLPTPDDIGCSGRLLFLPTLSRLAFTLQEAILIWDARDSKLLLNSVGGNTPMRMSFSSDGRFFACGTGQVILLWKESPAGYVLHQKLVSFIDKDMGLFRMANTGHLLSPDGELTITSISRATRLWRITDPITSVSGIPIQPAKRNKFILGFSPGQSLAAAARLGDNVATVLDLKSGDPQLIIDTGMKIHGLKVTESTIVVVGDGKIITWNVPAGDCVFNARANIDDSVQTVMFNHLTSPPTRLRSTSMSPDLNHVVIMRGDREGLEMYGVSTGKHLGGIATCGHMPWFSPDGREVWSVDGPGVCG